MLATKTLMLATKTLMLRNKTLTLATKTLMPCNSPMEDNRIILMVENRHQLLMHQLLMRQLTKVGS